MPWANLTESGGNRRPSVLQIKSLSVSRPLTADGFKRFNRVKKRFRNWSILLHPDRFVSRSADEALLIERVNDVYTILGETYQALTNAYHSAVHRYWLSKGQLRKALELDENGPIAQVRSIHKSPSVQSLLIDAVRLGDKIDGEKPMRLSSRSQRKSQTIVTSSIL